MQSDDNESLLMHITWEELKNINVQVVAYAFDAVQYDTEKKVAFTSNIPGTIKLQKCDGNRIIAMYGIVPYSNEANNNVSNNVDTNIDYKSNFEKCLERLGKIKNLKSMAISKELIKYDGYSDTLEEFSATYDVLVYVYTLEKPKVVTVHKSFGDLLGQIKVWRTQKSGWDVFFKAVIKDKTISTLNAFLRQENETFNIYPPPEKIFNAMILTKLQDVKVIIIGQDPYHTPGAAMGLAFSHENDYGKVQPSLRNVYKELVDCGYKVNTKSGDLTKWAKQGVFLINTALTVRQGQANSHSKEWIPFTEKLFKFMNEQLTHCVVIMWGAHAQSYAKYFDSKKHKKLMSSHPSPFSANAGFFGSKPFLKCNEQLKAWKMKEIDWNLA